MQQAKYRTTRTSGLLSYLLALTAVFFLFELFFIIRESDFYLGDFQLIAHHMKIPSAVLPGVFYFFSVQIGLHLLFTLAVWSVARLVGVALDCSWKTTQTIGFYCWGIGIALLLLSNQAFFPNSKFAWFISAIIPIIVGKCLLYLLLAITAGILLIAMYGVWQLIPKKVFCVPGAMVGVAIILIVFKHQPAKLIVTDAATQEQPNIIIIGVDALRPDFLSFFGHSQQTPQIDQFLEGASVFADALTPIARTFPSWSSILTGEYPKQSGIRFNLADLQDKDLTHSLPQLLREQGYHTIFATDETRFSNIDQRFGFDEVVTPPIGFNDFLLGTFNDFIFSNWLVNTRVGHHLLPYSYGNRPAVVTYDPNMFLELLKPTLAKPRTQPLFFAVHFCLPHYPYLWGNTAEQTKTIYNYQAAVKRVDQQFSDFFQLLTRDHLLERSIVILLSDHGEAFELPGDRATEAELFTPGLHNTKKIIPRFYAKSFDSETVNQSAGHGNDILGLTQYHIVFAWRTYGYKPNTAKTFSELVSLLDIKPTLLSLLHVPYQHASGKTLTNKIFQRHYSASKPQDFFTETDFSPEAVHSVHPETRTVLFQGIDYFRVDPVSTRVYVKNTMGDVIISSKEYADFYGPWVLALYPQNTQVMMPILVNLQTGQWTNDLRIPFAKNSPAQHMLQAMTKFFGDDLFTVENIS